MSRFIIILFFSVISTVLQAQIIWEAPIDVAESSYGMTRPVIKLVNGVPVVMWSSSSKNTYFSKYDGSSFSTPTQINPNGLDVLSYNWSGPEMTTFGNNAYIVYRNEPWEEGHIYLHKSTDGGDTWSDTIRVDSLDNAQQLAYYPHIAVSSDTNMTITFMHHDGNDNEPQYAKVTSNDNGETFSDTVNLTRRFGAEACDCCTPTLVSNGDKQAFLFRNNDNNIRDFKALYSTDAGNNFNQEIEVDDGNWSLAACPSSAASSIILNDNIYSSYLSNGKVFIAESNISDSSLNFRGLLTNSSATQNYPKIATNGDKIVAVWEGSGNNSDLFMNVFKADLSDYGAFNAKVIMDSTNSQYRPDLVVDDTTIYLVYTDNQTTTVKFMKGVFGFEDTTSNLASDLLIEKISISPNPAKTHISVKANNLKKVEIYNSQGKLVLSGIKSKINVEKLTSGLYTVLASTGEKIYKGRFIKD